MTIEKTLRQRLAIQLEVDLLPLVPQALARQLFEIVCEFIGPLPLADEKTESAFLAALHVVLRDYQEGKIQSAHKARVGDLNEEMSAIYLATERWMRGVE